MLVKMFFFVVLVRFSSSSSSCVFVKNVAVLDCSNLGLTDLELIYTGPFNLSEVKSLFLRSNMITNVNFSLLIRRLPSIQLLDLQENPFNCEKTALLEVLSGCEYDSSPTSPMFSLTSTIFPTNLSVSIIASKTTGSSTPRIINKNNNQLGIILATILPSCVILLTFILGVMRIRKRRRRQRFMELQQFSNPSCSFDSEENTYERDTSL